MGGVLALPSTPPPIESWKREPDGRKPDIADKDFALKKRLFQRF